ncbi:Hvo_1808 family surface protein [Haloarculaceae archaeon H-GB2-1]|nr:Hvo_1808 family surface protein [Haloarculaceae archaeon H-GB1-1]MEA5407283.1 Hvo_1808 family surface protein [Haloarculaceae archaeon H-GB2-1]
MRRALFLVVVMVLAGCNTALGPQTATPTPIDSGNGTDPESDQLGWEAGYWYDESLPVTPEDGYNETERDAVVARTMARVEVVRQLEFNESVPVEVISRAEYREQNSGGGNGSDAHRLWNNQVWEGLFLVGERDDISQTFDDTLGSSVQGYYSPGKGEIILVSDAPSPTIDRTTLSHELVHALQDQHFGLDGSPPTQDRQLARNGIVEGDAMFVQHTYSSRCSDEWECLPKPESGSSGSGSGSGYNRGLFLTIYQPYATGGSFVATIQSRSGWEGVNDVYANPPVSTEQVIHPTKYPDEKPVNVTVRDRSTAEWQRFDVDPEADTVGEASIYAMLVSNGAVEPEDYYSYRSEASAGWAGDALVPYQTDDERYGYVFRTTWDTREDATEFRDAYLKVLETHDAQARGDGVYVINESNPYGDAFRVSRSGKIVTVVNGPTVDDLDAIHE